MGEIGVKRRTANSEGEGWRFQIIRYLHQLRSPSLLLAASSRRFPRRELCQHRLKLWRNTEMERRSMMSWMIHSPGIRGGGQFAEGRVLSCHENT